MFVYGCLHTPDRRDPVLQADLNEPFPQSQYNGLLWLTKIPKSKRAGLKTPDTPMNQTAYPRVIMRGIFHYTPVIPHSRDYAFKGVDERDLGYISNPSVVHVYDDKSAIRP